MHMARPSFTSTPQQRSLVEGLAMIGIPHDKIAVFLDLMSPKTVRTHFATELARGSASATAKVAQVALDMAKSGDFPVMTMFWLNTFEELVVQPVEKPKVDPKAPGLIWIKKTKEPDPDPTLTLWKQDENGNYLYKHPSRPSDYCVVEHPDDVDGDIAEENDQRGETETKPPREEGEEPSDE